MESTVLNWRKSSHSGGNGGSCVEVANADEVLVRDTTDRSGPVLRFTPDAWRRFAGRVKRRLARLSPDKGRSRALWQGAALSRVSPAPPDSRSYNQLAAGFPVLVPRLPTRATRPGPYKEGIPVSDQHPEPAATTAPTGTAIPAATARTSTPARPDRDRLVALRRGAGDYDHR